ncbi:MAG: hypothetical protein L6R40_003332 [Gallowayella cf. fulva]|nr:MAG: hypothetical protein L6R40_003332 [Xanthomendoza cf. fulva]
MSNMGREDGTVLQIHKTQQPRDSPAQHEKDYTFPDGSMVKAIRHEHIRAELLHQAEATHSWKHPQPHGAAPDDRNAPCAEPPDQLDYGWTQHHYPAINFILKKRGYIQPEYEVKDWRDRAGSDILNDYILANLPAELRKRNTTRGWRDLTKAEIAAIKEPTLVPRPSQARKRASSEEAQQKREENIKKQRASAVRDKATADNAGDGGQTTSDGEYGEDDLDLAPINRIEVFTTEMDDFRWANPRTAEEKIAVREALATTIDYFTAILRTPEPLLDRMSDSRSYGHQINRLRREMNKKWKILNPGETKTPYLLHLTAWKTNHAKLARKDPEKTHEE